MGKKKIETSVAEEATDVNTVEVVATEVAAAEIKQPQKEEIEEVASEEVASDEVASDEVANDLAVVNQEEISQDAELIPDGIYLSDNGAEYGFTVDSFMFKGKKYDKAEALKNPEVLETLVSLKSFILKQL